MASKKLLDALNSHMKEEFYSGYFYLSMASHFKADNLPGFAKWFKVQAKEELEHAIKFYEYIGEVGGRATLQAIAAPPAEFKSLKEIFEAGLAHEKKVSAAIWKLMAQAWKEEDYATEIFLQWFVQEQVEEEANFTQALSMVTVGGEGRGVLVLDHQFGKRGGE
jgi:ferritin